MKNWTLFDWVMGTILTAIVVVVLVILLVVLLGFRGDANTDKSQEPMPSRLIGDPAGGYPVYRIKDEEAGCWVYVRSGGVATFPIEEKSNGQENQEDR